MTSCARDTGPRHAATARQAVSGINKEGAKAVFNTESSSRNMPSRLLRAVMPVQPPPPPEFQPLTSAGGPR